jgi:NADH:ubiquinone oxidoreductase subunit 3 (subunit A)
VIYVALVALLAGAGRALAGRPIATPLKSSTYSSGEAPPTRPAAPGYRPFFVMALFFAVLHLGVLMLGSGAPTIVAAVYLGGLMLALIALIAG